MVTGIGGMEINTKFKIGDRVWIIKSKSVENLGRYGEKCGDGIYFPRYIDEYYVGENYEIKRIEIKCYSNEDIDIIYYFKDFHIYDFGSEEYCFATKEEAQVECDKRNKGE